MISVDDEMVQAKPIFVLNATSILFPIFYQQGTPLALGV